MNLSETVNGRSLEGYVNRIYFIRFTSTILPSIDKYTCCTFLPFIPQTLSGSDVEISPNMNFRLTDEYLPFGCRLTPPPVTVVAKRTYQTVPLRNRREEQKRKRK